MTTYPGNFRDVIRSGDNAEAFLLASAPSGVDSNAGVFPGALAGDAIKVYALPAGRYRHEIGIACPGNSAAFSAIYDAYTLSGLPAAFTADAYRSAGVKVIDNMQIARANTASVSQAEIDTMAPYLVVIIRSVAVAPTNGTATLTITSR